MSLFDYKAGSAGRKTSLLDRAVHDLSNTAQGFFPGLAAIGGSVAHDVGSALSGGRGGFQTDDLVKGMGKGFLDSSFIPALASGHPVEAFKRASDRPFSALLDATLAFPAHRALATGATRLGHRTGDAAMLDWGIRNRGMREVAPEMAGLVGDALNPRTGSKAGNAPASLEFLDGPAGPTREYMPRTVDDIEILGDRTFLRRTKRTMPIGVLNNLQGENAKEITNNTLTEYLSGDRSAFGDGSFSTSLAKDPAIALTSYRAQNEGIARIGDAASELMSKIPAGRFSASSRIGSKLTRMHGAHLNRDVDVETLTGERLMKKVINQLRMDHPEKYGQMEDADIRQAVSLGEFVRAGGSSDNYIRAASNYSASDRIGQYMKRLEDEADTEVTVHPLDLSTVDARTKAGIYLKHNKEYEPGVDPFAIDPDAGRHLTVREFMDKHNVPSADNKPTYSVKVESLAHQAARRRLRDRMNETYDTLRDRFVADDSHLYDWKLHDKDGGVVELRRDDFLSTNSKGKKVVNEPVLRARVLEPVLSGEYMLYVNGKPIDHPHVAQQVMEGVAANPEDSVGSVRQMINDQIMNAQKEQSKVNAFDEVTTYELDQQALRNGMVQSFGDTQDAGIAKLLRDLYHNENATHDIDNESLAAYREWLDNLRDKDGKGYAERLRGIMSKEGVGNDISQNRDRLSRWVESDVERQGNGFWPMRYQGKGKDGQIIDREAVGNRGDAFFNNKGLPWEREPGDPFRVFLTGEFRIDDKVMLDNFKKNRELLASERLFGNLKELGMVVDDAKYTEMYNKGYITTMEEIAQNPKMRGNFIKIEKNDWVGQSVREVRPLLEEIASMLRAKENIAGSMIIRKALKLIEGMELDPDNHAIGRNAKAPENSNLVSGDQHVIIPADIYMAAKREMENSKIIVGSVMKNATEVWKYMVLHARFFEWMRNNIIGAHLMAALSGGVMRYASDMARIATDPKYRELMKGLGADERMADVLSNGQSSLIRKKRIIDDDLTETGPIRRVAHKVQEGFNYLSDVNNKVADNPTRTLRIMQGMEDQLSVFKKLTGQGDDLQITPEMMERYMTDDVLRGELARRTNTEMVDFSDMSAYERKWLVQIFPFWSWMKGSTKAGARLWADKPGTVWAAGQISDVANERMEDQHGPLIPDFARSWFDPGESGGNVLSTSGFLPYMTPIDFTQTAAGLVPGFLGGLSYRQYGSENLISNANPILGGTLMALTGRNTYFGTPLKNDNFIDTLANGQTGLPIIRLLKGLYDPVAGPDQTTEKDRALTLLNYAGVPIRDPRWGQTHRRGADELNERYRSRAAMGEL